MSLNGVVQAEYVYNAYGQQAVRTLTQSGQVIHSIFGPDGNRIAEYDEATGDLLRQYVWLGLTPVAVIEGGQVYFVRTDFIGRPVLATTAAGSVAWTAKYLPFGAVETSTGATINLRFPGQWFQSESGLHQNWMRDYDPTTGRYIQADPLGLVDGASVYGYALQNPGMYVDSRGEIAQVLIPFAIFTLFILPELIEWCLDHPLIIPELKLPTWLNNDLPYAGGTPDDKPGNFIPLGSSGAKKNTEDGSIWEKDHSGHGGTKWKRWPSQKNWEKNRGRESVRPDGSVRG